VQLDDRVVVAQTDLQIAGGKCPASSMTGPSGMSASTMCGAQQDVGTSFADEQAAVPAMIEAIEVHPRKRANVMRRRLQRMYQAVSRAIWRGVRWSA
jgi:hypothetical protein